MTLSKLLFKACCCVACWSNSVACISGFTALAVDSGKGCGQLAQTLLLTVEIPEAATREPKGSSSPRRMY